jgi:hypothetical protein
MSALTNFCENKWIDWFFRGQALGITGASAGAGSGPTNLYVGLFTVAPGEAGGGTEVAGGGYARAAIPSSLANWAGTQGAGTTVASTGTTGTTSNNNPVTLPAPTGANWGVVVAWGVFDAPTGGNLIFWAAQTPNKTVNDGDAAPSFAAGQLQFQIDN